MKTLRLTAHATLLAASIVLAACGGKPEGDGHADHEHATGEHGEGEHGEGEHGDGEHDHGDHDEASHGDGHVHAAVFEGTVVELGEHYANLEFKHDSTTGTFELWTMDAHNENTVPSPTEAIALVIGDGDDAFTVQLQPEESASKGWKVGASAHFEATDERLVGMESFHATVTAVSVRGEDFKDVMLHVGH